MVLLALGESKSMKVTVLSQDTLFRDGICSILGQQSHFRIAGVCDNVTTANILTRDLGVDIVIVDMSGLVGRDLNQARKLRETSPAKVVMIVNENSKSAAEGADQVVLRSSGAIALLQALRAASGDDFHYQAPVPVQIPMQRMSYAVREPAPYLPYGGKSPRSLTPREQEVAQLVAQHGMSNRRIALELGLREQSIKNLVSTVMRKLDCENRVQVALRIGVKPGR